MRPRRGQPPPASLDAQSLGKADTIVTHDFGVADTVQKVIVRTRDAGRRYAAKARGHVVLDAPFKSPAGAALYSGSAVEVAIPVDDRLAAKALTWLASGRVSRRLDGVKVLAFFHTPAHERALRGLLKDPDSWTSQDSAGKRKRVYAVRKQAWKVLSSHWKVRGLTRPVLEEPLPPR